MKRATLPHAKSTITLCCTPSVIARQQALVDIESTLLYRPTAVGISQRSLVTENSRTWAIVWRCLCRHRFSRLYSIPQVWQNTCTQRNTDTRRRHWRRAVKTCTVMPGFARPIRDSSCWNRRGQSRSSGNERTDGGGGGLGGGGGTKTISQHHGRRRRRRPARARVAAGHDRRMMTSEVDTSW